MSEWPQQLLFMLMMVIMMIKREGSNVSHCVQVYVWIYDPVNAKTFLIGLLMVLGAIGLCMFPLWPEEVRVGVYYLSLSAAGFVGFILSLVVSKFTKSDTLMYLILRIKLLTSICNIVRPNRKKLFVSGWLPDRPYI